MHTVLLAIQPWLSNFKHYNLVNFTDNTAVLRGLRYRSVRGPAMDPIRKIAFLAALHDIEIHPQCIPTHENVVGRVVAELLSRH